MIKYIVFKKVKQQSLLFLILIHCNLSKTKTFSFRFNITPQIYFLFLKSKFCSEIKIVEDMISAFNFLPLKLKIKK